MVSKIALSVRFGFRARERAALSSVSSLLFSSLVTFLSASQPDNSRTATGQFSDNLRTRSGLLRVSDFRSASKHLRLADLPLCRPQFGRMRFPPSKANHPVETTASTNASSRSQAILSVLSDCPASDKRRGSSGPRSHSMFSSSQSQTRSSLPTTSYRLIPNRTATWMTSGLSCRPLTYLIQSPAIDRANPPAEPSPSHP